MKKIDLVTNGKITREKLVNIPKNKQGILLQLIENQNEIIDIVRKQTDILANISAYNV